MTTSYVIISTLATVLCVVTLIIALRDCASIKRMRADMEKTLKPANGRLPCLIIVEGRLTYVYCDDNVEFRIIDMDTCEEPVPVVLPENVGFEELVKQAIEDGGHMLYDYVSWAKAALPVDD